MTVPDPVPPLPPGEHRCDLGVPPAAATAAAREAAEAWGAEWQEAIGGGRLELPVVAGIRRGVIRGRLTVAPEGTAGSRLTLVTESRDDELQGSALAILFFAALGGLLTVVWPFYPPLLPVAPFGAILALSGWFLVVSRLRTSGADEFLDLVARIAEDEDEDESGAEPR